MKESTLKALVTYVIALFDEGQHYSVHGTQLIPPGSGSKLSQFPVIPDEWLPDNIAYNKFTGWFRTPRFPLEEAKAENLKFLGHLPYGEHLDVYKGKTSDEFFVVGVDKFTHIEAHVLYMMGWKG